MSSGQCSPSSPIAYLTSVSGASSGAPSFGAWDLPAGSSHAVFLVLTRLGFDKRWFGIVDVGSVIEAGCREMMETAGVKCGIMGMSCLCTCLFAAFTALLPYFFEVYVCPYYVRVQEDPVGDLASSLVPPPLGYLDDLIDLL